MKLTGIARPGIRYLTRLAGYFAAGLLSAACCLEGRAPLAAGLLAACRPDGTSLAALAGAAAGSFLFLSFGGALRCCGILILICSIHTSFRDTTWFHHPLFRPLTAAGTTLAVELAYTIQTGVTRASFLRLVASAALAGLLCHYCALVLREMTIPRRKTSREAESLKKRLRLSVEALRSLCESFGGEPRHSEENPAVIFDRAAEVTCRGCALRDLCWNREYTSTFNAFNDATPAILERGRAEPGDFAAHFSSRCIHFPQLLSAISAETHALLLRRQYRRQLDRERSRTRGQYAQLTELVAQAMAAPELPSSGKDEPVHDVAMGTVPKDGQRICGDSVASFRGGGSLLYLLLSDGMGSGREAQRESALALRLTEQFLKAGIHPEPALKTLNAALNLRSDTSGGFTTIDLLCADLSARQARLYKYGAAPTYIKHHGSVRRLTGSALPAGLQDTASVPPAAEFPLEENSFILMVSDGVADSSDDKWLQDLLAGWHGDSPHVLVSLVLGECRKRRCGDDDCSALCLYLPGQNHGRREV